MSFKIKNITGGDLTVAGHEDIPSDESVTVSAANSVAVAKREDLRAAIYCGDAVLDLDQGYSNGIITGDDARRFLDAVADGTIVCADPA